MFSYITSFFEDPKGMLIFLLLALPGRVMALSFHEWAHAYVANKCGDPTARMMGRMTLNPAKHLDPLGTIMMLLLGFGWANPVPVNPNNFRNPRKDDIKVSLAGVTMNLILFLTGFLALSVFLIIALKSLPEYASLRAANADMFIAPYLGERVLIMGDYYYPIRMLFQIAPYAADLVIAPALGRIAGYAYQMLSYFVIVNLSLALFNLIPVPPLDGYHVLNDTILHKSLFAAQKTARIAMLILFAASMTGILGQGLSVVIDGIMSGVGSGAAAIVRALGLI